MNGHKSALVIACAFALGMAPMQRAIAGPVEAIRGGVLAQSCCAQGRDKEEGVAINGEVVFRSPAFLRWALSPNPVIGASIASDSDATSAIYAGLDWRFDLSRRFFVGAGAGGALHNGETGRFDENDPEDAAREFNTLFLGCRALFRLSLEAGARLSPRVDLSAQLSHMSNANLCAENEGLDHAGVRIGVRF